MPFPQQGPRPYDFRTIASMDENQNGVYGLFTANPLNKQIIWIYIGQGNIRDRLLKHFKGENPDIAKEHPTRFVIEITQNSEEREKQLILELDPIVNKRVG